MKQSKKNFTNNVFGENISLLLRDDTRTRLAT